MKQPLEFEFTKLPKHKTAKPFLLIKLTNPHNPDAKPLITWGLIDTGAEECAISSSYAEILKHSQEKGKEKPILTGSGKVNGYSHTATIEILNKITMDPLHTLEKVTIDFVPSFPEGIMVLGVKSFLSNFTLTLKYDSEPQEFSLLPSI